MDLRRTIVELIDRNDGKWTWYQLERGLTGVGLGGRSDAAAILTDLVQDGVLSEQADQRYPHPLYRITEKGKLLLAQSITESADHGSRSGLKS
jgi:hypothetical protein